MNENNFKTLEIINGQDMIFNPEEFKLQLKLAAKRARKMEGIRETKTFREEFAKKVSVSESALKQWESGRNGVSDLERLKEIAQALHLLDYKILLKPRETTMKGHTDMVNREAITERERETARTIFEIFVDIIQIYRDTIAFSSISDEGFSPSYTEIYDLLRDTHTKLLKSRFDLPFDIYQGLYKMYVNLDSEFETAPAFLSEEYEEFEKNAKDGGILNEVNIHFLYTECLCDELYESLCSIMRDYLK